MPASIVSDRITSVLEEYRFVGGIRMLQKKRKSIRLTGKKIEEIKSRLLSQKEALWAEILHDLRYKAGKEYQDMIQQAVRDQGEEALVQPKEGNIFVLVEIKFRELENIEHAIERIETGGYGRCSVCGEWISPARLESMPSAIRCRKCQERLEVIDSV